MAQPLFRRSASLILLAALLPLLAACDRGEERAALPDPLVSVATVRTIGMTGDLSASGRLIPREEVAVASELAGYRIARVLVEEDAVVRQGELLAELDDTLLRSQITQARATLAQQQVAAERSREEARRVAGLDNQGVLSQEAIMQRRLAARSAVASVEVAEAQLNDLLIRDRRLAIRAPRAGRVLERAARPGDTSSAGTMLFTIARDDLIELYAEVPEASVGKIAVGDPVRVTLASGEALDGKVRLRGARVDNRTGLVIVRVALPVNRALRAGGFAKAAFKGTGAPARVVPERAIKFDADGASVLVVGADQRVRRVGVRTGRRAGGMAELLAGPPDGARVVLGGSAFLLEGDKVRVAPGAAR
ncbi:HlyD family secretion protein [Sphingomonas laterariae]|uniref:HlyD family secretion protein n=1 Tax=Edaphosphingomonas laterariae TaxID=861865 RepID=A0A239G164_9SPHN|nr:efflux RND transporter periplasmic adaptor subunit [Sphingomonas laterariae]SNS62213.1 HlyD family secretion protein [Sphingomonas laterariae]